MKKYLPYTIFGSALFISIVAEYFSIFGISKLFSGAKMETIFLAIGLGIAKLVTVTSIQTYWKALSNVKLLRVYLILAAVVLMIVTSAGTYGFLANAYQATAQADKLVQTKIDLLKTKRDRFKTQLAQYSGESSALAVDLGNLRKSLSTDNQYQSIDRRTGQVLTQVQTTSKKAVQDQLNQTSAKKDIIDQKIDWLNDSINQYDYRILKIESTSESSSELGPLKYLSGLTGYPMDKIINWLMLLLVCVIDPLAIALVLTSQFAMKDNRWIRGVATRKRNEDQGQNKNNLKEKLGSLLDKIKKALRSPTIDDHHPQQPDIPFTEKSGSKTVSTRNKAISNENVEKKKRGRPKGVKNKPKIEHFNVDIDPIADPEGILGKRTTIEAGLNETVVDQLAKSLEKKS